MNSNDPNADSNGVEPQAPDDFNAMMWGALVIFVVTFIPWLSLVPCLPQMAGAMFAIHLFTKKYGLSLDFGDGAKLGILTAILGGLAAYVVVIALHMIFHYHVGEREMRWLLLKLSEMSKQPDVVKGISDALEAQKNQPMTVMMIVIGVCSAVFVNGMSGALGGILGALLFKRGGKPPE